MSSILADTTTVVCPACTDIMFIPKAFLNPETETSYQLMRDIECGNCRHAHQAGAFLQKPGGRPMTKGVLPIPPMADSLPVGTILAILDARNPQGRPIGFVTEFYHDEQGRPCAKVLMAQRTPMPIPSSLLKQQPYWPAPRDSRYPGLEELLASGWSLMKDQIEKGLEDAGIDYWALVPHDNGQGYLVDSAASLMDISAAVPTLTVSALFGQTFWIR